MIGGVSLIKPHREQRGFTLIELLVVTGIISLLLALVVPSLEKAKDRVYEITCQSNLKQWGIYMKIYADDNNGYLPLTSQEWLAALLPYSDSSRYSMTSASSAPSTHSKTINCCPKATAPMDFGARQPFASYTVRNRVSSEPMAYGSYGINGWISNPAPTETEIFGVPTRNSWKRFDLTENTSRVPMLMDSMWMKAYPDNTNEPPTKDGDFDGCDISGGGKRQIRHFCIDRHGGEINGIFMDLSLKEVGLKSLWQMKWHRGSNMNAPEPTWPAWMKNF